MKIKAILFDLDGTLLQMDQDSFVNKYFGSLISFLARRGFEPKKLARAMGISIEGMIKNTGGGTNEEVFWSIFSREYGKNMTPEIPLFEEFYNTEFDSVSVVAEPTPAVPELIRELKSRGYMLILATNPVFPLIATKKRALWTGVDISDFELVTSYENSYYSKPNIDYYKAILSSLSLSADECLMVGNDVSDDMIAKSLGMKVFLLTNHLINKDGEDINNYPNGDFSSLMRYISEISDE